MKLWFILCSVFRAFFRNTNNNFIFQTKFPMTRNSKTVQKTDKSGKRMISTTHMETILMACSRTTTAMLSLTLRKFLLFSYSVRKGLCCYYIKLCDRKFVYTGGPGSGKVTHCDNLMIEKRGIVHINMTDLLQQYTVGNGKFITKIRRFYWKKKN